MTAIVIRDVPDEVRDKLAARAARSGWSLQEFLLRQLSEMATRPSTGDIIAQARERVRTTGTRLDPAEILGDLDADRR
jgi:plasmid stability protein